MSYDIISHAKKVKDAADTICRLERELGRSAFADAYRRGRVHLIALGDEPSPKLNDSDRVALRVYVTAQDYVDTKRHLALNLVTEPQFSTITTTDSAATSVIRAIGLNQPFAADRVLQPLLETSSPLRGEAANSNR